MKQLLVLTITLLMAVGVRAQNTLSLSTATGHPGDTVDISLSLANVDAVVAFQTEIDLGGSLTYVANSLTVSERVSNFVVQESVANGRLQIVGASLSLSPMNGNSGQLCSFKLVLGTMPGTHGLNFTENLLSNSSGQSLSVSTGNGSVTVLSPKLQINSQSIDFGHIPIRSTYNQSISVTNVGNEPLTISALNFSKSTFNSTATPVTIAAGNTEYLPFTYAPVRSGAITEKVEIVSNSVVDNPFLPTPNVTLLADPFAVNEIHIGNAVGYSDSIVTVQISVNNMDTLSGFQCSFKLPSSLEYVENSFKLSSRKTDHQAYSAMEGDTLVLVAFSPTNDGFVGEDGVLATASFRLIGQYGTYYLTPLIPILSDRLGNNVLSASYRGSVQIRSPRLSCVSTLEMGMSSVIEQVEKTITVYNNGNAPLIIEDVNFFAEGFSVLTSLPLVVNEYNGGQLTIAYNGQTAGNFSTIMAIHSNDPVQRYSNVNVSGTRYEPNSFELSVNSGNSHEDAVVSVKLNNYTPIAAVQFEIELPAQYQVQQSDFAFTQRCASHSTITYKQNDSLWMVIVYSIQNQTIIGDSGSIVDITLHPIEETVLGTFNVELLNGVLSDANSNNSNTSAMPMAIFTTYNPSYTVATQTVTGGSVVGNIGSFVENSQITLTAVPENCHSFTHWRDGSSINPRTFTLTHDTVFVAEFEEVIVYGTDEVVACDSYTWNGEVYTQSGTYTQTLQTVNGCDSVVTLYLTVNNSVQSQFSDVACDSYTWNGEVYTQSGIYTQTLQTVNGCDSVVTLYLTVNNSVQSQFSDVACDSYTWNGEVYTQSGIYTQTLQTVNGCDSVVTLYLTVNNSVAANFNESSCDGFVWNGITYTQSGDYVQTLQTTNGCDSVVTMHLTIHQSFFFNETATVSAGTSYVWTGHNVSVGLQTIGTHIIWDSLQTIYGCDSIYKLNLTVINDQTNGLTLSAQSGLYTDDVTIDIAMDNQSDITAIQFDMTIPSEYNIQPTDVQLGTRCGSHSLSMINLGNSTWRVMIFSMQNQLVSGSSGVIATATLHPTDDALADTYSITLSNIVLSDILAQNRVTVPAPNITFTTQCPVIETTIFDTICENDDYNFFGTAITQAGIYTHTLETATGCDSIVNLNLTINPITYGEFSITTSNDSYEWNGENYTQTGDYTQILANEYGCDSIATLHLTISVGVEENDLTNVTIEVQKHNIVISNAEGYSLQIYNNIGQLIVAEDELTSAQQQFHIQLSGVYIVRVGGTKVQKVIVM